MRIFAEKTDQRGFIYLALGSGSHCLFECVLISINIHSVERQKNQRRHSTGSLVSINKRVVFYDVKEICSGHFTKIAVEIAITKTCFRHCQSGLQKAEIPYAQVAAVSFNLVAVNFQNLGQVKEYGIHG